MRTQLYDRRENGCRITVHNYTFYPCLPPVRLSCGLNEVAKPVREMRFLIGPGSGNDKRRKVLAVADLVLHMRFAYLHQSPHRLNDSLPELWAHLMTTLFYFFLWRCGPMRVMASSFLMFLDHTQRRTTVGGIPLVEWSARRRDLYLTTHNTRNKHPCPRLDSNPRSVQASGHRPTP